MLKLIYKHYWAEYLLYCEQHDRITENLKIMAILTCSHVWDDVTVRDTNYNEEDRISTAFGLFQEIKNNQFVVNRSY